MPANESNATQRIWLKIAAGCAVLIALATISWFLSASEQTIELLAPDRLRETVVSLGIWGPVVIAGLIAAAVVVSPIPSAPIALAAGAVYGHLWGSLYVLVGAELGALIAFGLARFLGYDLVRRWVGTRLDVGLLGSQNLLMVTVFLSRLLPFVSFDIVSYAAGLTSLSLWRFAAATLAGILPASFLLAHFGGEIASADARRVTLAVLLLGGLTALPLLVKVIGARRQTRTSRQITDRSDQTRSRP